MSTTLIFFKHVLYNGSFIVLYIEFQFNFIKKYKPNLDI
ncbi:hypothetical protein PV-S19_0036 [Pacmanvirus S19]|nr:hypothetical protein PV-S19_0036 [Pacmanvirus S19]